MVIGIFIGGFGKQLDGSIGIFLDITFASGSSQVDHFLGECGSSSNVLLHFFFQNVKFHQ